MIWNKISAALPPSGLLAVYKPKGLTSSDVVAKVKWLLIDGYNKKQEGVDKKQKVKLKVGHGGTLDPMATGVLVLGVGEGTKLLTTYLKGSKSYRATGKLGVATDTLDCTGTVTDTAPWEHVALGDIKTISKQFVGDIMQTPPMYSALKSQGKRLYDLARDGKVVDRAARPVTVYSLTILEDPDYKLPEFHLDVECSGGFYVRSLIDDIGRRCNSRSMMTELERTKQGPFLLNDCAPSEKWGDFEYMCAQIDKCSAIAKRSVESVDVSVK